MLGLLKRYVLDWLMSGLVEENECGCEAFDRTPDLEMKWVPHARYSIRAGGMEIWADNYKFGLGGLSLDVFWTQKIGGVEKSVSASIFETSFTIIDYETTMTSKVFDQIRESNIDFTREAEVQEIATKRIEKRCIPQNTSLASSYA
jgi:hypothetical protein